MLPLVEQIQIQKRRKTFFWDKYVEINNRKKMKKKLFKMLIEKVNKCPYLLKKLESYKFV